jgi:beta-phosphoglucomutase
MRIPDSVKAVIFDFDGVLVDSEPLHEWAIRRSVEHLAWDFSHDRFLAEIVGRGDINAYRRIAEWNNASIDDPAIHALLTRKWDLMREGVETRRYTLQPGALNAARAAAARGPTAVCSGSVRQTVHHMLEHAGLRPFMRAVVCGDEVSRMKPDPEGYLTTARLLNVRPEDCLVIEDTPTGVKAGKAAGMFVVGVCHTVSAEALHEADIALDSIARLAFA